MNNTVAIILSLTLPCLATTLGAALIFFFKKESRLLNLLTIGLASGIMLSASFWSLLVPSLEYSKAYFENHAFIPVTFGFLFGTGFMTILDLVSAKIITKTNKNSQKIRAFKIFSAITIHNVPEGLSVGFAIGTAAATNSAVVGAFMFAVGIAIQNFPEGLATALPIYSCITNKHKSFWLAFLSGIVEPLFAVLGYFLSTTISYLLPWLLSFSAGAMIYVIVEELLPEINTKNKSSCGIWAFVVGFIIMMMLDICL